MGNPMRGEAELVVDGTQRTLRLTLGALAELEEALGEEGLIPLIRRFEEGRVSGRDVIRLIVAGLRGGGWEIRAQDLLAAEIEGGPAEAARVAGLALVRAFAPGAR